MRVCVCARTCMDYSLTSVGGSSLTWSTRKPPLCGRTSSRRAKKWPRTLKQWTGPASPTLGHATRRIAMATATMVPRRHAQGAPLVVTSAAYTAIIARTVASVTAILLTTHIMARRAQPTASARTTATSLAVALQLPRIQENRLPLSSAMIPFVVQIVTIWATLLL
jgi:hypothetical protein